MLLQISFSLADALNLRTEIGTLEAMGVVGGGGAQFFHLPAG